MKAWILIIILGTAFVALVDYWGNLGVFNY